MSTTTPGETAYTAYWPALGAPAPVPWADLSPVVHTAWEAAAQAVLKGQQEDPAPPTHQWYEEWACRLTDAGHVEVVCPVCGWTCLLKDAGFGWMERHWAEEHTHA